MVGAYKVDKYYANSAARIADQANVPAGWICEDNDSGGRHLRTTAGWTQIGAGVPYTLEQGINGGGRNENDTDNNMTITHNECNVTEVDLSTNSTTVSAAPAFLCGIYVDTALSAHVCLIVDGATTKFRIPASTAVGAVDMGNNGHDVKYLTSLIVDPDDAATGIIRVYWQPIG